VLRRVISVNGDLTYIVVVDMTVEQVIVWVVVPETVETTTCPR
jgi:hypothetical protein